LNVQRPSSALLFSYALKLVSIVELDTACGASQSWLNCWMKSSFGGVGHTQWPTVGVSVTLQCWHGKSFVLTGIHDCTCKYILWVREHGSCPQGHLRIQLGKLNCHELFFRNLKWPILFIFYIWEDCVCNPTLYLKQSGAPNYNMAVFLLHFITKTYIPTIVNLRRKCLCKLYADFRTGLVGLGMLIYWVILGLLSSGFKRLLKCGWFTSDLKRTN